MRNQHESWYKNMMYIGAVVLVLIGISMGIGAIDFHTSSLFNLFAPENIGRWIISLVTFCSGLLLVVIGALLIIDTLTH